MLEPFKNAGMDACAPWQVNGSAPFRSRFVTNPEGMGMRVVILTVGTRGDVQPYVALGRRMKDHGWDVCVATHVIFRSLVESYGLEFAPLSGDPGELLRGEAGKRLTSSGPGVFGFLKKLQRLVRPILESLFQDVLTVTEGAGLLLHHILLALPAQSLSEARGIPAFPFYLQHVHPTSKYPAMMAPVRKIPGLTGLYNRLTYWMGDVVFWKLFGSFVNEWRQSVLGLRPWPGLPFYDLTERGLPFFYGISPHVLPRAPEWPDHVHLTGYWFLRDPEGALPYVLEQFIQSGPPPVYIGFGSMPAEATRPLHRAFISVFRSLGQRVIIQTGDAVDFPGASPDVFVLRQAVPHDRLFPKCRMLVHHGGAGTTAMGFLSGRPQLVIPFYADQAFWAWRVEVLGTGRSLPAGRVARRRIERAVASILDNPSMDRKAEQLGQRIREEDGPGTALKRLEAYL